MKKILLNGEQKKVRSNTLQELLIELAIQGKRIAVELNLEIIPRGLFEQTQLHDGDKVEIVHAIGGG